MDWEAIGTATLIALLILLGLAPLRAAGLVRDGQLPEFVVRILKEMTDAALLSELLAQRQPGHRTKPVSAAALAEQVNSRVIGQEAVVNELAALIASRSAKVRRRRPVGVFLISGPPGTGKSELGKAVGDALPGGGGHYLVEMNRLKDGASLNSLFGAAPGFVGSDRKAGLMNHLLDHPSTVIILDEFEKACLEAQNAFLAAWQEGYIRESTQSAPVSTADAVFILTSNAKEAEISALAAYQRQAARTPGGVALSSEELSERCRTILRQDLPAPVLSRVDRVFAFAPLSPEALAAITLKILTEEVADYGLILRPVPPQILVPYVDQYDRPGFDTRDLYRHIERDFGDAASTLKAEGVREIEIIYDAKTGEMTVRAVSDRPQAPKAAARTKGSA